MIILGAALATPAIALPGFPLPLALCLSCRLLLPPPPHLASASPRPSLPPPRPGHPGLASLPRRRAPLRRGGGGGPHPCRDCGSLLQPRVRKYRECGPRRAPSQGPVLGRAGAERDPGVLESALGSCEWSGRGRHPCVRAGCAARRGARTRRVRPWTLRLWRPVPIISLSPGCFSSPIPAPPGCSLRLRRYQTGKGFLAPSPLAGAAGPTWPGGGGRWLTPNSRVRGRGGPGGWREPRRRPALRARSPGAPGVPSGDAARPPGRAPEIGGVN